MSCAPVARRLRASQVPGISGIRLTPAGGDSSLVNISSSGVLVECSSRLVPKTQLTVHFEGTFCPASVEGRVARCQVAGIGRDGALRYHIGIAFAQPIPLDIDAARPPSVVSAQPPPPEPPQVTAPVSAVAPEAAPAPASVRPAARRNRW